MLDQDTQVIGVEIGHPQMGDQPLVLQLHELFHGVDIAGMLVHPPMQLKQVYFLGPEPLEAFLDRGTHGFRRHDARLRAPLGQHARLRVRADIDGALAVALKQAPRDQLGAAVMVRHVEGVETGAGVVRHGIGRLIGLEQVAVPLHIRDLPQAGDNGADFKAGAKHTLI